MAMVRAMAQQYMAERRKERLDTALKWIKFELQKKVMAITEQDNQETLSEKLLAIMDTAELDCHEHDKQDQADCAQDNLEKRAKASQLKELGYIPCSGDEVVIALQDRLTAEEPLFAVGPLGSNMSPLPNIP